ncbi:MAG: hypothetical protein ACE5KX_02265 [Acidimicrobiia bacterium]
MPLLPYLIAALVFASSAGWALRLVFDQDPFATEVAAVIALDVLLLASIAIGGLLIARGPWARALAAALILFELGLAAVMPLDPAGAALIATSALALVGIAGPWLSRSLRRLPSAGGPPPLVVALALGLLALPTAAAVASPHGLRWRHWLLIGLGTGVGWAFTRAWAAALWMLRLVLPVAGLLTALASPAAGAVAVIGASALLTSLSWTRAARLAVAPLSPPSRRAVPIPPELVPPDLLDAAGYDDRGRPREVG